MDEQVDTNAYVDAADNILINLKTYFGEQFREYFVGDPVVIPESQLPCMIVDVDKDDQDFGPTGFDRVSQTIVIKVVLNKRDDFNGDTATSRTKRKLKLLMAGRDATTKQYLPNSVLGIVRKYLTLSNEIENYTGSSIDYGIVERNFTGNPQLDSMTAEAQLTLTTTELIQVDNRA